MGSNKFDSDEMMVSSLIAVFILALTYELSRAESRPPPSRIDTSLPATYVGLHLKSLAKRELGVVNLLSALEEGAPKIEEPGPEKLQRLAVNLETKLNLLDLHLSKLIGELSIRYKSQEETLEKLVPPCCSTHLDEDRGCAVIHLGFNGTRIARLATTVFDTLKPPRGV